MRRTLFLTTISAAVFGLVGCGGAASNNSVSTNGTMTGGNTAVVVNNNSMNGNSMNMNSNKEVSGADNSSSFMMKAAQGGMAEVELGKLAASKAHSPEVKAFGQKMVVDHTKANDELKAVAAKENVSLPPDVNAEQKEMASKLSKLSGAEFDKEYVNGMVEDHEKDVADFQKQADGGSNADAKSFAAKTLPTLKMHLEMIKSIQSKMK